MFRPGSLPLIFYKILEKSFANISPSVAWKKEPKDTPLTGLEPAIFGLGGRRVIHYATEAGVDNTVTTSYYLSNFTVN